MKLKIKKIGNSTGLLLPKELLIELGLTQGNAVYMTALPDGGARLIPYDPEFERATRIVDDVMDEYKDTLRTLAK